MRRLVVDPGSSLFGVLSKKRDGIANWYMCCPCRSSLKEGIVKDRKTVTITFNNTIDEGQKMRSLSDVRS